MKLVYWLRLIGIGCILAALLLPGFTAHAANPQHLTFSLRPGGKAQLKVFAFCLDQDKKFPTNAEVRPAALADEQLRKGLTYIVQKDYDQTNFKQAAFAIWYLRIGQWHNKTEPNDVAQEIVNAASNAAVPPAAQGIALHEAQAAGIVDAVTRNFTSLAGTPIDPSNNYFGVGTLEIVNKTDTNQTLYLAFGTVFPAPGPEFQALMVYGTEVLSAEAPARPAAAGGLNPAVPVAVLGTLGLVFAAAGYVLRPRRIAR